MLRKSIIISHKTINAVVAIVAALLFLICLYAMIDAYNVYAGANDSGILKYKPESGNTEKLRELSDDAVAWLTVDDTRIDYPVMQGKTNDDYLNKDPYGEFSLSGSIFLDSRNEKMFSDPYSLVYGHHMEYGAMFGSLDGYADREYFDAHKTGTLTVIKGAEYKITFFAACKAQATEKVIFDPTESNNQALLAYLNERMIVFGTLN